MQLMVFVATTCANQGHQPGEWDPFQCVDLLLSICTMFKGVLRGRGGGDMAPRDSKLHIEYVTGPENEVVVNFDPLCQI